MHVLHGFKFKKDPTLMGIPFPQPVLSQPVTNTEKYILSHRLYYDNCVTASRYSCARLEERPSKGGWNDVSITRKWKADGYLVMGLFYMKKTHPFKY